MEDYPRTIQEFERRFSKERNCWDYLVSLRWPDGFQCPRCKGTKAVVVRDTLYQCYGCRHQTSATAGTILQDTRKPLIMWFGQCGMRPVRRMEPVPWDCSECWAWPVM